MRIDAKLMDDKSLLIDNICGVSFHTRLSRQEVRELIETLVGFYGLMEKGPDDLGKDLSAMQVVQRSWRDAILKEFEESMAKEIAPLVITSKEKES